MSELIDLTAAAAAERIRAREIDPAELFEAYRARAAANDLNAYTWVAEGPPQDGAYAHAALGGVPVAVKDLFCSEGVPSQAGSRATGHSLRSRSWHGAPVLRRVSSSDRRRSSGPGRLS